MTTIPILGVSVTPEVACLASVSQSQLWEPCSALWLHQFAFHGCFM